MQNFVVKGTISARAMRRWISCAARVTRIMGGEWKLPRRIERLTGDDRLVAEFRYACQRQGEVPLSAGKIEVRSD